jgi:predicted O-methyltransferase YrrM
MNTAVIWDALCALNLNTLRLAARKVELAREYWATSLRTYDEFAGKGLGSRDPLKYVRECGWASGTRSNRVVLPATLDSAGGTRIEELAVLGAVTALAKPKRIFEIGTFMGRTTSVFVLNSPATSEVFTLDLPVDKTETDVNANLDSDIALIRQRRVGAVLHDLGLDDRHTQLFADTLTFDPTPFAESVELGFIDGAHARRYVENDTAKMATMVADRALVFWHDYGGKGRFRELTEYLELLASKIPIYRVPRTTLAWTSGFELKHLFGRPAAART